MAADKSFFGRLQKLFSTNTIVRKTKQGIKVIDTDEYQGLTTNLIDRYTRMKTPQYSGGLIESAMAYQQVRIDLFRDYDGMDNDPILSSALDIYADESTVKNEMGDVLKINCANENTKEILRNLFYDILNIEFNLWPWSRNLVKYGDFFLHLEIAEELGIVGVQPLSTYETSRVEGFDQQNPQRVKFVYAPYQNPNSAVVTATSKREFENYEIAHFRLYSDSNFLPYGKSMLEGGRRVWKQLTLMEDAMLIHRIMRAPEKRVFKIDIGNINPQEVDNYMQKIINKMKKTPFVDKNSGDYNLKYNIQNLTEDFFLPVRGGDSGTSIENLAGLDYAAVEDIDYLKAKLFAALKVPFAIISQVPHQLEIARVWEKKKIAYNLDIVNIYSFEESDLPNVFTPNGNSANEVFDLQAYFKTCETYEVFYFDRWGNVVYRHTAQNFNPMIATAGKITVVEVEEIVEPGALDPAHIHTPGIYVDRLIVGTFEKRIEQRTLSQG